MVVIHELSANLVVTLEKELNAYQKECRDSVDLLTSGRQLPRTRVGWLSKHYQYATRKRPNPIRKAIEDFNRSRGKPVSETVFNNERDYIKCMAPIEVDGLGIVVYRAASDSVWSKSLQKQVTEC